MSFSFRNLFKKEGEEGYDPEGMGGGRAAGAGPDLSSVDLSQGAGTPEGVPSSGDLPPQGGVGVGGAMTPPPVAGVEASPFSETGVPVAPPSSIGEGGAPVASGGDAGAPPFGSVFTPPENAEGGAAGAGGEAGGDGGNVGDGDRVSVSEGGGDGGESVAAPSPFTTVKPEQGKPFSEHPFYVNPPVHDPLKGEIPGFQPIPTEGASWAAEGADEAAGPMPAAPPPDSAFTSAGGAPSSEPAEMPSLPGPPPMDAGMGDAVVGEADASLPGSGLAAGESPFAREEGVAGSAGGGDEPPPLGGSIPGEVSAPADGAGIPAFPGEPPAANGGGAMGVDVFDSLADSLDDEGLAEGLDELASPLDGGGGGVVSDVAADMGAVVEEGHAPSPEAASKGDVIELPLRSILAGISPEKLGFDATQVPPTIVTRLPFNMVKPQLATGRVTLLLEVIRDGCDGAYQPAFAKGDLSHRVALPVAEVMRHMPPGGKAAASGEPAVPGAVVEAAGEPVVGDGAAVEEVEMPEASGGDVDFEGAAGALETPFSQVATEDAAAMSEVSVGAEPVPEVVDAEAAEEAAEAEALLEAADGWPAAEPGEEDVEGVGAGDAVEGGAAGNGASVEEAAEPGFMDPFGGMSSSMSVDEEPQPLESLEAAPFDESAGTPAAASTDGLSSQEIEKEMDTESNDLPVETYLPTTRPMMGETIVAGQAAPGEAAAPVVPGGGGAGGAAPLTGGGQSGADFSWGDEESNELLELRAALMTDEVLTSQRVAELASNLPGIGACLILSGEGEVMGGNFPSSVDTEGFAQMAPQLYANMRDMSTGLGVGNAETFTVHTDRGMVSFFIGENRCLSVLHSSRRMVPGVRERLFLIARELGKLHI
ncbi:MAG: roadblock/LC7 domain-containing protein [Verrucomicrobiota bacterium]